MSNNPSNPSPKIPPVQPIQFKNPYNAMDIQNMKQVRANMDIAQKHLDLAKKAGIDTTVAQQNLDQQRTQLDNLIKVYGNPLNFT